MQTNAATKRMICSDFLLAANTENYILSHQISLFLPKQQPVRKRGVVGLSSLVVGSVGFTLGIEDTGPVFGFEVELRVHVDLDFEVTCPLTDWVCGHAGGGESTSDKLSQAGWAPGYNLASLQAEFGSKDGILDGPVVVDLAEGKGLVDGRALVTEGVNRSFFVDSNADGEATSDTRGCLSRLGEVLQRDARDILEGTLVLRHRKC